MAAENLLLQLPDYDEFIESISCLSLELSGSALHGLMCGYLCAGADHQAEAFLRALLNNKRDSATRQAASTLFSVFSVSQQQINNFDFDFSMLLPADEVPLLERTQAFSEWCEGFTNGLTLAGVGFHHLFEEDAQEALQHLTEFAELDCDTLDVDEEDEKALMEISEYTRMAVLRLHNDLASYKSEQGVHDVAH
jgi:uncharacterized protein